MFTDLSKHHQFSTLYLKAVFARSRLVSIYILVCQSAACLCQISSDNTSQLSDKQTNRDHADTMPHCRQLIINSVVGPTSVLQNFSPSQSGPSRATAGPGKPSNHYRGALSQPHFVGAQIETPKARRRRRRAGGNVGRDVPSPSHQGSVEVQAS